MTLYRSICILGISTSSSGFSLSMRGGLSLDPLETTTVGSGAGAAFSLGGLLGAISAFFNATVRRRPAMSAISAMVLGLGGSTGGWGWGSGFFRDPLISGLKSMTDTGGLSGFGASCDSRDSSSWWLSTRGGNVDC
jgi:hypothetical protein